MGRYDDKLNQIRETYPRFEVVPKAGSRFMLVINWFLKNVLRTGDDFMTRFITTIGNTMYTNEKWETRSDDDRYCILVHEVTHTEQMHNFPFGKHFWFLNWFLFPLAYVLILPTKWTFRAKFEREAFTRQIIAMVALNRIDPANPVHIKYILDWVVPLFSGPNYFYMAGKDDTVRYFTDLLEKLAKGVKV